MTDINDIFVFNNYQGGLRFLDKSLNVNERRNYNNWWNEQLHQYGTIIDYYTSNIYLIIMNINVQYILLLVYYNYIFKITFNMS